MFTKYINDIKAIFRDKYVQAFIGIFSIIFGLVKSLSEFVYDKDEVNVNILQSGTYALICYLLLNFAYYIVTRDYKVKPVEIKSPCKLWWTFFAILLLSYVICWLNYWPGIICYDSIGLIQNGLERSSQHPIAYIIILHTLVKLGSVKIGIIVYTTLSISLFAATFASIMLYIQKQKVPSFIKYLSFAYFLFNPLFATYSINVLKDSIWSCFFCLLCLFVCQLLDDTLKSKKFWILFCISVLGTVLFRNTGPYIIVALMIILIYLFREYRKQLANILGCALIAIMTVKISMYFLNAKQLFREMTGIPQQQIAAVIKNDGYMTEGQKKFINNILVIDKTKELYNPYQSGKIRGSATGADGKFIETHQKEFLKVWLQLLPKNFMIYIKAYLQSVYWFWAPRQSGFIPIFYTTVEPEPLKFINEHGIKEHSLLSQKIESLLHKYYNMGKKFFREGVLFWLLLASLLLYYLKYYNMNKLIIYLPCFFLWGTLMIATLKAEQYRFILPFAYLLPFFVALLFAEKSPAITDVTLSETAKKYIDLSIKIIAIIFILWYGIWYFTIGHPIKARIDLSVPYDENEAFVALNNDKAIEEAEWMNKFGRRGIVIQENGREYSFILIPFENTDIKMVLRGPDERDTQGKRYERWVKYTDFRIDGKKILLESIDTWHDKPFVYILKAEKNHLYKINLKWRKK